MPGVAAASVVEAHILCQRNLSRVDGQDIGAALAVWRVDHDGPIETPGPQQRRIEDVRTVRGGEDDHAFCAGEPVHLRQDLVQGLLALIVAAERVRAARAPDGVDLVDEDDRRGDLSCFREQFADPTGADADDHLDEL